MTTPPGQPSAIVIHAHHALGDGLGMLFAMSPMLGVEGGNPLSTVPLPNAILPPFARKRGQTGGETRRTRCNLGGCLSTAFKNIRYFFRGFFVMMVTGHDTELGINEQLQKRNPLLPFSGKRQLTRFPVVPLSLIKKARENHNCTLNDIVMAAVTGAFRKYCLEVCNEERLQRGDQVEFKSMVMIALPRECSDLPTLCCDTSGFGIILV